MSTIRSIANESLGWLIGTGILLVIAGAFAVYAPLSAGLAASSVVAVLLIVGGIAHFTLAWKLRLVGGTLWEILVGVAYVAGGLVLLAYPISGLVTLTIILAVYLFGSALMELLAYYGLRFLPGSGWLLLNGLITLVLAVVVLRRPAASAAWLPGTLVGFSLLTSGISRLGLGFAAKGAVAEVSAS